MSNFAKKYFAFGSSISGNVWIIHARTNGSWSIASAGATFPVALFFVDPVGPFLRRSWKEMFKIDQNFRDLWDIAAIGEVINYFGVLPLM